jgi:hypothetical protein
MPKAIELLRQGKHEELWQMCCGFLNLSISDFMDIQRRLMQEQLELLNNCPFGEKIMRGARPKTIEEFRRRVPLTTYKDYCPDLIERNEDILPVKPAQWVHTSGRSGEYPCKWVPLTPEFCWNMSVISYGVGLLSACEEWGDPSNFTHCPKIVYAVAPRPYMSGAMASLLELQTPSKYMPPLEEAEDLSFEERIAQGFRQALSEGFDYFFGMSLVLVTVGNRFSQSSSKTSILPLLKQPKALLRLARGMVKSKLARRPILPRDLWSIKGIMSGGLDSLVYRDKIKELWGRYPLDVYAGTEGGIYATQTWDYGSMTFIPNLNFFEFIPEEDSFRMQMDSSYRPRTLLLDEVEVGKNYEIVITNFHGGALVRFRPGDMVTITSLRNEKLGINLPQMVFDKRIDGMLDFVVVRLTEKTIWQAVESTKIPYEDWTSYKEPGKQVLKLLIEVKEGYQTDAVQVAEAVHNHIMSADNPDLDADSPLREDFASSINFKVDVTLLPSGAFASFTEHKKAEGADLAHLKPPHVNPSDKILSLLLAETEEIEVVKKKTVTKGGEIAV